MLHEDRRPSKNRIMIALFVVFASCSAQGQGGKTVSQADGAPPQGLWVTAPSQSQLDPAELQELIENLESIGYLAGLVEGPAESGLTILNEDRAYPGYNLYCSGHGPEAVLIDMRGTILHRWTYSFSDAFPNYDISKFTQSTEFWRRVYLYPNGDLLAIFEGHGLIKIDRNSKLIWAYTGKAHHDLFVTPEDHIYVLTRSARVVPRVHPTLPILEDFIVELDKNGKSLRKISLLEAYEKSSDYAHILDMLPQNVKPSTHGDVFHTNTIEVFDGALEHKSPLFRRGNIMISSNRIRTIAIIDGVTGTVVWAWNGPWLSLHQPTLLDNGNVLLYENLGNGGDKSRILEIDILDKSVVWQYAGDAAVPFTEFASQSCGTSERLPNGNTLITATDTGRAFEITYDSKEIVWNYYNPHRAGPSDEFIAVLLEVIRLPMDFPLEWLEPATGSE